MSKHRNKSHRRRSTPARLIPPTDKEKEALNKVRYRKPRSGCTKCFGRGFIGHNSLTLEPVPCGCQFHHPPEPIKPKPGRHSVRARIRKALMDGTKPSEHDERWLRQAGINVKNRLAGWFEGLFKKVTRVS